MTLVPDLTEVGLTVTAVVVARLRPVSAAPMVQPVWPRPGRASPRWSVPGQTLTPRSVTGLGITSSAGLWALGSMVCVGPPLLASLPSSGLLFTRSVAAVKLQAVAVLSLVRL